MFKKILEKIKNKRLLVVAILLFFAVNIFAVYYTFSEKTSSTVWDGSVAKKFNSGSGTSKDPYVISNGSEFAYFFSLINGENSGDYFNKFYVLNNNIDFNGYDLSFAYFGKTFSGNLDGNGYSLSNFKLNNYRLSDDGKTAYYGLFDSLYSANIKNFNFNNITFDINEKDIVPKKIVKPKEEEEVKETEEVKTDEVNNDETKEEEKETVDDVKASKEYYVKKLVEDIIENGTSEEETPNEVEEKKGEVKEEPKETPKEEEKPKEEENEKPSEQTDTVVDDGEIKEEEKEEPKETPKEEVKEEPSEGEKEEENKEEKPEETEEYIDVEVENIVISFFGSEVEKSKLANININNININYTGNKKIVTSSLFIVNDNGDNTIENINVNGNSNIDSTTLLISKYDESTTIKNILFSNDRLDLIKGIDANAYDDIFQYDIEDGKLFFYKKYPVSSILEILNNNSSLRWKLHNNKFLIENNGAGGSVKRSTKSMRSAPSAHASGLDSSTNTVYVNDYVNDANYYEGLNYTYSSNNTIPTLVSKNIYSDTNLVYTQITYYGTNYEGTATGTVSKNDNYNKYVYYKVFKVNDNGTASNKADDYILIDLIDNPFSNHPIDLTFNGWLTTDNNITVVLDSNNYIRKAKVPVTYSGDNPQNLDLSFYSIWGPGKIVNYTTSWSNTFSGLEDEGFNAISGNNNVYEDLTVYYFRRTASRNSYYPTGSYNSSGTDISGNRCTTWGGCTYYIHSPAAFDPSESYYRLYNGSMRAYTPAIVGQEYHSDIPIGTSISGYFRRSTIPNGGSLYGHYNASNGTAYGDVKCTTSGGCQVYEQIKYLDSSNNPEVVVSGTIYYHYTTRDTNMIVLASNITGTWSSSEDKPFTFTSINGNTNNYNNYTWTVSSSTVTCYADTRIENMRISSGIGYQTNDSTPGSGSGTLIGNNFNLKIGRRVASSSNNNVTFNHIMGSKMANSGSTTTPEEYTLIVESGVYNNIAVVARYSTTNYTYRINASGTFGNDFDRLSEADPETSSSMDVRYDLSGSFSGNIYGSSANNISIFTNVKSGRYGTNKYDCYAGVYIGSQLQGTLYSARAGLIEGGYIFNLIGGPLSASSLKNVNDTFIYITGGYIDLVFGGAGVAATYGNKIIQMTGGQVNYSIFGGSNGINGSTRQKATVDSNTYVYVGGNATVGKSSFVSNNTVESKSNVEAGSIFGAGNGQSGSTDIGSVNNSYVVIDGNATINRNVYGGGNFAATGIIGSNQTYESKINIYGGDIKGNTYGGGNNNNATSSSNTLNATITMNAGSVEGSVFGGFRTRGIIFGSTNVNINGGTVYTDVYGGGEGGYRNSNNPGTYVVNNVAVSIGNSAGGPNINGSVYGGSAYGTVNGNSNTAATNTSKNVTVTVNNGTVLQSVFGGAKGGVSDGVTYTPKVNGNVTVTVNGGQINSVYGGCDEKGQPGGTDTVNINGGQITNVYGGGNKTAVTNTNVYMAGGTVTSMFGGSNQSGDVTQSHVYVQGGIVSTVYGGNNEGGSVATSNVNVTGGTINTAIYGGGKEAETGATNVDIYNIANTVPAVYGGGREAGATSTDVVLHTRTGTNSISITDIYGGSNQDGDVTTSSVTMETGTVSNIYGGNNAGGETTTANVTISGGTVNTAVYGGGNEAETGSTVVSVSGGNIATLYGGGNEADTGSTSVSMSGGTVTTMLGGGNKAGIDTDTSVTISGGTLTHLYGGGNEGDVTGDTSITITNHSGTITDVYGGGNKAGANSTSITLDTGNPNAINITTLYGGSNQQGNVGESTIEINAGNVGTVYGGNNAGGKTTETNVTQTAGIVGTIYGGGNVAESDLTHVTIDGGTITNIFGGGNQAVVTDTTEVTIHNNAGLITNVFGGGSQAGTDKAYVTIEPVENGSVIITNVFGGSNQSGTVNESHVTVDTGTIGHLYGGNNAGGTTVSSNIEINDGTIGEAFGGGNAAVSSTSTAIITGGTITDLYAGGNAASITNGTTLTMTGGIVTHNAYGGGNEGTVGQNTNVIIHNAYVNGSAYAGGNGSTATVYGNTNITVSGTSTIGTSNCTLLSTCSVFGGGNAATTGSELTNNSTATVNITGAKVYGNVYGGANTSRVYGEAYVNIGADVTLGTNIVRGDIDIVGTVFGGGEANASGSDTYDWTFVSVTRGIVVNINGANYNNFKITGSIFGSGNASTSGGTSTVYIKNYGTFANPQRNVSIQRTNLVYIDNSAIVLSGATDRENEYSDVLFTLSRIDELDLTNNSTLFLETGANLLQHFRSLTSTGQLATVEIDKEHGTVTKNVDNRVYMYIDKKLNIAKDQSVTDYGEVDGMSFFGMYKYNANDSINVGIYGDYAYNATLNWGDVFDNVSSYVLGLHKTNHDITVDGFYTNYIDEATSKNLMDYIEPSPPTGPLYMWTIGEGVIEYEVDLVASKYSTLGTYELSLRDFTHPNTTFQVLGFDYSEMDPSLSLVDKNLIKKIADTDTEANTIMGLSMETSNNGWLVNGYTSFMSNANNPIEGTEYYIGGNNESAPNLLFYLHHSKNISTQADLGKVTIQMLSIRQVDALTKETMRLIITVNLTRVLHDTVNYEGAMTAGRKYDLFTSTATNITSSSSISAYYSLFNMGNSIYRTGYHRTLVSNYVLPLNTKITMIDFSGSNPEYYYHVIDATDVANAQQELQTDRQVSYNLSMFEIMGAENSGIYYNDAQKNNAYFHSNTPIGNYVNEEFIFIIDFGDTTINSDQLGNQLLIEIRDQDDEAIYAVLAPQHLSMTYNIYANKDAVIDINGTIDRNKIYNGESLIADLEIDYTQSMVGSTIIYDTHHFDSKLGLKISLLNSDNEVITGTTLLGLYYEIDGVKYYPNIDGTARIKIADKVDSAEKWVIVNTGTSTIASGNYKLRIETFGSPDGIYYGLQSSDSIDFNIEIVNEIYGLDVTTSAEEMIIDKDTGLNDTGTSNVVYHFTYNSGLTDPSIHVKMYRRGVSTIDDTSYTLVDLQDYLKFTLQGGNVAKEYLLITDPNNVTTYTMSFKDDLMSGTYKMEFILYDSGSIIGTVDKYIIIK